MSTIKLIYVLAGIIITQSSAHAELFTTASEFSVPLNPTMGADSLFTPYANVNGNSYFVWVDNGFRPWVTQKTSAGVQSAPLDSNPDYTCFHEGHHRFSLGVDKNGYIHISGDMHHYPSGPDSNSYMPVRYRNQNIMYWISNKPYDVTGGFNFAGGGGKSGAPNDPRSIYTGGIVYSRFFHSRTGDLYWTAMVHAVDDNFEFLQGQMGVALHKYNPGPANNPSAGTWTALGGYATPSHKPSNPVPFNKVLFWADAGLYSGVGGVSWFQGYKEMFQFDLANRLHFASGVVPDPTYTGTTRVMYAMSPDGGTTWKRANGSTIPGLPLRGEDSSPNVADVVLDTHNTYGLQDYVAVSADASGNPAVFGDTGWHRWDGQRWNSDIYTGIHASGDHGLLGPDGRLTFIDGTQVKRMSVFDKETSPFELTSYLPDSAHFLTWASDIGLYKTESLYGVVVNDSNLNTLEVRQFTFTPTLLPIGWSDQDVGDTQNRGGSSDFLDDTFTLRASGSGVNGINGNADELHYTYTSLQGDGTMIARIANQHTFSPWYFDATEGVMMRETLDANSKFAMMGLSYKNGARWMLRTAVGAPATDQSHTASDPLWVKLVRAGNLFTGYQSLDGSTWIPLGTPQTISMKQTIYVGLMAFSYSATAVHQAIVDNVTLNGVKPQAPVSNSTSSLRPNPPSSLTVEVVQ